MDTTELKQLAANTPVHDRRRYALRRAASEIERLEAELAKRTRHPAAAAASTPYKIPNSTAGLGGLDSRGAKDGNRHGDSERLPCIVEIGDDGKVKRLISYEYKPVTERMIITEGASHE